MLIAGSRLLNSPVMGLQTGGELARTKRAIIDPGTLGVLAYEIEGPLLDIHPSLLRIPDVREFSDIGLIVDSSDEFVSPDDIVKLGEIYKLHFEPVGMTVLDKSRKKLGRVDGYTIETSGFIIQQLNVKKPLLKSLNDSHLLIHRSQIIEINNTEIVVHSEAKVPQPVMQSVRNNYVNPFRHKTPQAEQIDKE